jgi:hypothetical protein
MDSRTKGKDASVNPRAVLLLLACCMPLVGCYRRPLLRPAGPLYQQQQDASLHDPYSDNDLGPEVVGGRPREFAKPMPEPVRNRRLNESWN